MSPRVFRRRSLVAVAMVVCATAVAACSSSGNGSKRSGTHGGSFLAFSECMRSHGVPNFPDPTGGGGIHLSASSGINPAAPSFEQAQATCMKKMPGGGPPAHASEQQKRQLFAMSECMRSHGVTGFPDPVARTGPPANPQAYSQIEGTANLWLLVPITIKATTPAFRRAAKTCRFR